MSKPFGRQFERLLDNIFAILLISAVLVSYASPAPLLSKKKLQDIERFYGSGGVQSALHWQELLEAAKLEAENKKLIMVNDYFNNRIQFMSDKSIWNQSDYWATPLQTLVQGKGDCEDFSIAKYVSLLKVGVSREKLRLVYVKAKIRKGVALAHMVLAYYQSPTSDPYILDNLNREILPSSKRPDLKPIFSFNSDGLWVGNALSPHVKNTESRLSHWRDILIRMKKEGIGLYE